MRKATGRDIFYTLMNASDVCVKDMETAGLSKQNALKFLTSQQECYATGFPAIAVYGVEDRGDCYYSFMVHTDKFFERHYDVSEDIKETLKKYAKPVICRSTLGLPTTKKWLESLGFVEQDKHENYHIMRYVPCA